MIFRDQAYYQRRWQIGFDGNETNGSADGREQPRADESRRCLQACVAHGRVERLRQRPRRTTRGARRRGRRASSAGASAARADQPSICSGISCPHSEPAAREIDSFISVPPRSLTPARERLADARPGRA